MDSTESKPIITMSLIRYEDQIDLVKLYLFSKKKKEVEIKREKFFKLYDATLKLAASYLDSAPEAGVIKRLRREIRIQTRGFAMNEAEDAVSSAGYVSFGTEQLYNAESYLVKKAYRKIAPIVHPDSNLYGGKHASVETFQMVNAAYKLKDLTFLQDLYFNLVKDNVFWRCSDEAHYWLDTELQRPQVTLDRLRTDPTWQIGMLHQQGKPKEIIDKFVSHIAQLLVIKLQAELNYILTGELPFYLKKKE